MSDFVEAVISLLPSEAGGRRAAVEPREGSYRPWLRAGETGERIRVRVIEGPPRLAPGDEALVVAEVESAMSDGALRPGAELELVELEARAVGIVTVQRIWRRAVAV